MSNGPGAGHPHAVGVPDVLATVFEVVLAIALLVTGSRSARRERAQQRVAAPASVAWSSALALVVAVSTSLAITIGMG